MEESICLLQFLAMSNVITYMFCFVCYTNNLDLVMAIVHLRQQYLKKKASFINA